MGTSHAISALTKKLGTLRGREQQLTNDISDLESARSETQSQVRTLEKAIRILEPEYDLGTVAPVKDYFILFKRGELGKYCLATLKGQQRPLTHLQVAEGVVQAKGLETVGEGLLKKVRIALYGLVRRGLVERVGKKNSMGVRWRIAKPKATQKNKEKAGKQDAPRLTVVE